jgi:tRNA threonylcarbamoyladenosine biosynthesis protein TsaE
MARPDLRSETRRVVTGDAESTRALGVALGALARPGDVVCLTGPLGVGKTQLAKGFAAGLGVSEPVVSPSFVLMAEHHGRLPLFHIDLYRLDDASEAIDDGLLDEREADGVTLIEWADRLGASLPGGRLDIAIDGAGDEPRSIGLRATDARHARYLEVLP